MAGFDFPIGVPRAYAEKAGFGRFPDMLLCLGAGSWADFYNPAESPDEISLWRPFYPRAPGGTRKQQLVDALGLHSAAQLLRLCDRATNSRGSACEIFWTLGAKQVGRAAIHGWRNLLAPAVRDGLISIWPFDGDLDILLGSGKITVLEAYPAETYGHLGLPQGFGKEDRERRRNQASPILSWCQQNGVVCRADLSADIEDGFGAGDDAFDAVVGLLGLIEAVNNPTRCVLPQDSTVQNIEGWTLGTDPAAICQQSISMRGHRATRPVVSESLRESRTPGAGSKTERGRLCPACQTKKFARWPWGWDGHAAHNCPGISGNTPEERKRAYRERYLN